MNYFKSVFLILIITVFIVPSLVACGSIGERAKPMVDRYCERPLAERLLIRATMDPTLAPNKMRIVCAVDGSG